MNYIKQLQTENTRLKADLECIRTYVDAFRQHLNSDKFSGTEQRWIECAACGDRHVLQSRKDWIATADVHQRLAHIQQFIWKD